MSNNNIYNLSSGGVRKDSLKINIDIDQILLKRDKRVAEVMLELLEHQVPFMLYTDVKNYAVIDPNRKMIATYARGRFNNRTFAHTEKDFANGVRLVYVCHEKIYVPSLKLGGGEGYLQGRNFVMAWVKPEEK